MSKKSQGAAYLLIAAVIAAFLGWLWYKHSQLLQKIGVGQSTTTTQTAATDLGTNVEEFNGAPL